MTRSGFVNFHESLEPLMCSIEDVSPHPANPRNGDIEMIAESITINGFISPVIAQKSTGHIIAGNHRYFALHQLGSDKIPVIWVDVDDLAAKRYLLADNRTSDLGNYDNSALVALLEQIDAEDSLLGTGYKDYDLEVLKLLTEIPLDNLDDFAQWPTLSFQVPPHVKNAFTQMTSAAGDDRERFELLMRLAGWDGHKK